MEFRLRVLQIVKDHSAGAHQREMLQELYESMIVISRVREELPVEMMPEDSYIAHIMALKGVAKMTPSVAGTNRFKIQKLLMKT